MTIDTNKTYSATLETSVGEITIDLNAKATPVTVNNFVTLARKGFYNGTVFHRVIKDFMVQGGDPTGTGRGGPGYTFADEPIHGEYARGTVAMANAGPNTNGSQFFIMHGDVALPKNYVIFGAVTAGLDTVDKIATAPVGPSDSGEMSRPVTPVAVRSVSITER
ncbi:MAG: peptidylprolyl isomerase [Candidatus Liptonbacteria bacterium]|nr:peptidylprolyl isomerase [Candidatus Liptonbacteria bacterium]